jgi:hypothetical protein
MLINRLGLCVSSLDVQYRSFPVDVRLGQKADLPAPKSNFRFTRESGLKSEIASCPFGADFVAKVS